MELAKLLEWLREWLGTFGPWVEAIRTLLVLIGIVTTVFIYATLRWIKKLRDRFRISGQELENADKDYGALPEGAVELGANSEHWEALRAMWREVRERTELLIASLHGNMRRHYDEIN